MRDRPAADNRMTERLLKFRPCPVPQHERDAAQQRGHGRHRDRGKPRQACLVNGFFAAQPVIVLLRE